MRILVAAATLALVAAAARLVCEDPSPGALAAVHAALPGLPAVAGCAQCHSERGLDAGCLACHSEIAAQLDARAGYHARLVGDCAGCHPDHHGSTFDVRDALSWGGGMESFDHSHVVFSLHGAHEALDCAACHRGRSFLGLSQDCGGCHAGVHGDARFSACAACHEQEAFVPAPKFRHPTALTGAHAEADCASCHEAAPDFAEAPPHACAECHQDPHRTAFGRCERCHGDGADPWRAASLAVADHARTGFPLAPPHDAVACASCHDPALAYAARHRQVAKDDCASCHGDPHRGQFDRACLSCHGAVSFSAPRVDHSAFPLRAAHARAACASCHPEDAALGARRFTGTPSDCASCHGDPHAGQLGADCASCHDESAFLPARFGIARHDSFPLTGAHAAVSCRACHQEAGGVRRFSGTPRACADCHADPHGRQFAEEVAEGGCASCHEADASTFSIEPFDHSRTRYPLSGAHAEADCASCHAAVEGVRAYRGTPSDCASCHTDPHRGQLRPTGCAACHEDGGSWEPSRFDHARTGFPLDERHAPLACASCHPAAPQPDGARVVQYRPLGTRCGDCHATPDR